MFEPSTISMFVLRSLWLCYNLYVLPHSRFHEQHLCGKDEMQTDAVELAINNKLDRSRQNEEQFCTEVYCLENYQI